MGTVVTGSTDGIGKAYAQKVLNDYAYYVGLIKTMCVIIFSLHLLD